jgi:hypothetical protein
MAIDGGTPDFLGNQEYLDIRRRVPREMGKNIHCARVGWPNLVDFHHTQIG